MIKNKRQHQILDMLNQENIISISSLAKKLGVSAMTVRRDLEYFERMGSVRRVHGGATLIRQDYILPTFKERLGINSDEKIAIGKVAASLIENGSVVAMDGGTTTLALIKYIPESFSFTTISSGIMTTTSLSENKNFSVIQVGGTVLNDSKTVFDSMSSEFARKFNADIAFLSTRAVDINKGTFESNSTYANEKLTLSSIARTTVVLADNTKFNATSLCLALQIKDIDILITDKKTPANIVKVLREKGIDVLVAD